MQLPQRGQAKSASKKDGVTLEPKGPFPLKYMGKCGPGTVLSLQHRPRECQATCGFSGCHQTTHSCNCIVGIAG